MRTLARLGTCAATLTVTISSATTLGVGTATAGDGTTVVLDSKLRRCDFSLVTEAAQVQFPALGSGSALIRTSGSTATAEVHVVIPNRPGTHYDVGLIQEPRPSSATCGPGDPGTAYAGLDTDAAGSATVTIQEAIQSGTTGVWVIVERPNPHSQNPAEFYTSEFLAPV